MKNLDGNFYTLVCCSLTNRIEKAGTRFPKSALSTGAVVNGLLVNCLTMTCGQVKGENPYHRCRPLLFIARFSHVYAA